MKSDIHPPYFETKVTCACGNIFTLGSTKESIHVDSCSKCHPFFTGEQRFLDTEGRVEKFRRLQSMKQEPKAKKDNKPSEDNRPRTLKDMLQNLG